MEIRRDAWPHRVSTAGRVDRAARNTRLLVTVEIRDSHFSWCATKEVLSPSQIAERSRNDGQDMAIT